MIYQPKGGQCATCFYRGVNCSALPFTLMPVIERQGRTIIVKCTVHIKEPESRDEALQPPSINHFPGCAVHAGPPGRYACTCTPLEAPK